MGEHAVALGGGYQAHIDVTELVCGYRSELWHGEMYPADRWFAEHGKSRKKMAGVVHIGVTTMVETWMFVREVRDHVQYSNCLFPTAV
jgi:hypothetical protein